MQEFGYHTEGRMAFGVLKGYAFSIELVPGSDDNDEFWFRFVVDGGAHPAALLLRRKKIPRCRWHAERDPAGGMLVALYQPQSDFYAKAGVYTVLHEAVKALQALDLNPPAACPLCQLEGADTYACLNDGVRATHAACLDARLDLPEEDSQPERKIPGFVVTGILGALVGAFIAALPIWALALGKNTLYWALYAFIPILSGLVYRLFRGKAISLLANISVLVSSLLATFALEQVWYWLYVSATFGRNIPFVVSIQMYFDTHTFGSAVREMLLCLIALLVGFIAVSIFLRRYASENAARDTVVRGARFVRASAFPMHPKEEPAEALPAAGGEPGMDTPAENKAEELPDADTDAASSSADEEKPEEAEDKA